ncbi:MAG: protein-L-isoaspartate(D-aspartate) O-methyltransferase [Candidatus Binatia bacterium]
MNITILSSSRIPNRSFLAGVGFLFFLFFSLAGHFHLSADGPLAEKGFSQSRRDMVENDLRRQGIKDQRVLKAMTVVPRHLFVPEGQRAFAYANHPLPIGKGQTISQPYIVALMSELLELEGREKVLEIGTGSGYQAAVLSHLAGEVYTIEIIPSLAQTAKKRLARLRYSNVWVKLGDGFFGWKEKSPFDAILITASAQRIPEPLWHQLREKGRLVMPMRSAGNSQRLVRVRKVGGKRHVENVTGVIFVPMTGAVQKGSAP